MGDRLDYSVDLPGDWHRIRFANMLISLVENAIKHGLEPSVDGGTLVIAARREGDRLLVSVTDGGRGLEGVAGRGRDTAGDGVGLTNIRERLAALFGSRGEFTIESAKPRGTRAIIAIPEEAQ